MVKYSPNNIPLEDACKKHMEENGLPCADQIKSDGVIHRYSKDRRPGKIDEWYIAFIGYSTRGNQYIICTYGSWRTGAKFIFKSYDSSMISASSSFPDIRAR